MTGVKTGHTFGAGYVLVGSGRRKGVELISVVIGAPTETERDLETACELLDYGFSLYRRAACRSGRGERARRGPRSATAGGELPLRAARSVAVGVRRDQRLSVAVRAPSEVEGPIRRGAALGPGDASSSTAGAARARCRCGAGRAVPRGEPRSIAAAQLPSAIAILDLLGSRIARLQVMTGRGSSATARRRDGASR